MTPNGSAIGEDLAFLAPGILHQLGNALFRVQGHAQLLPAADLDVQRERMAILEAVDRASHTVQLCHWLVGDGATAPVAASGLLVQVAECLRVPLRERGLRLEMDPVATPQPLAVDGALFVRGLLLALRQVVTGAVPGCGGRIRLGLPAAPAPGVAVRLELLPEPAVLPFPWDTGACVTRLIAELGPAGVTAAALPGVQAVLLTVPAALPGQALTGSSSGLDPAP